MQAAWARGTSNTSAETATPLRSADLAAIGAMVLDSPRVNVPLDLAPSSSSAGSSIDGEAGSDVSPGKIGPSNFELLRVVGQGAFGKVLPFLLSLCKIAMEQFLLCSFFGDFACCSARAIRKSSSPQP